MAYFFVYLLSLVVIGVAMATANLTPKTWQYWAITVCVVILYICGCEM